jgi:predicted acetyltransferase
MAAMATLPDGLELVTLDRSRLADVLDLDMWAFPTSDSIEDLMQIPSPLSWERTHALREPAQPQRLVAMHSSYPFRQCPVPGGRAPVAGLTWVGVHPQWRRRGLLSAMIGVHLQHCRDRGEAVSLLTASEPAIYGRFGYGLASRQVGLTMTRKAPLRPVQGSPAVTLRFETVEPQRHDDLIARLHGAVDRPGWVTRETPQLRELWLNDAPVLRAGREADRIAIAERDGAPVGYALFRRKVDWAVAGPEGTVDVRELVAADPAVTHALWSRLLDLDLTTAVTTRALALDDPLLSLLVDVRAARPVWQDNTWARIVDLAAALSARRYQAAVDVVLDVRDDLLPDNAGRWHLRAAAFGPASVERTARPAGLSLDIRELGAAYLGGTSLAESAAAGLVVDHGQDALASASVAFGWPRSPVCSWIF